MKNIFSIDGYREIMKHFIQFNLTYIIFATSTLALYRRYNCLVSRKLYIILKKRNSKNVSISQ